MISFEAMKKVLFLSFLLTSIFLNRVTAQIQFDVSINRVDFSGIKGLQSFAWASDHHRILFVGGRVDGLHQRQPFASFSTSGQNNQLIVLDVENNKTYTAPLTNLPADVKDQFSATNFQFFQEGNSLYLTGGYGYSVKSSDHITFPFITKIQVSQIIDSVINQKSFASCILQKYDTMFAVTGGSLNKINHTFYLSGGHKFTGRYNPMGPNHGPGFLQSYTNAIRIFQIEHQVNSFIVNHLKSYIDDEKLHRRDYNVVPQIFPDGKEGLTLFSGVFKQDVDLPFLSAINVDSFGFSEHPKFSQYYNHYHCAHVALFDNQSKDMHNLFFGGIAQFYDSNGILVQDNNVPFVNTIGLVTRDLNGDMKEFKMSSNMPTLLGAGSEFIVNHDLPKYLNEVIKLDELNFSDSIFLGYIFGGIKSNKPNIFFSNTVESSASSNLFKVFLHKNKNASNKMLNGASVSSLMLQVFPIPNYGDLLIEFELSRKSIVHITIKDYQGKILDSNSLTQLGVGKNQFSKSVSYLKSGGIYFVEVDTGFEKEVRKIIVE